MLEGMAIASVNDLCRVVLHPPTKGVHPIANGVDTPRVSVPSLRQ